MTRKLTRVAFGLTGFFFLLLLAVVQSKEKCSKTCVAKNCKGLSITYGKYCGIGYYGCRGEPPCDDLDACCMTHDDCVDLKGMTYVDCHKQFQRCVSHLNNTVTQPNNKKFGFSLECPYSMVIPTVYKGMNYGIFFSGIGNVFKPSTPSSGPVAEVDLAKIKRIQKMVMPQNQGLETKQRTKVFTMRPSPS
ncbi:unnamed protein product [Cochlearia groenlandica]